MGQLEPRPAGGLAVPEPTLTPELVGAVVGQMTAQGRTDQLLVHQTGRARAWVYAGEWVADCPAGCNNVEFVTGKNPRCRGRAGTRGERYTRFTCTYCGHAAPIEWPADAEEIMLVLDRRPIPHTRNWFPAGHRAAIQAREPDGQTVAGLITENQMHGVR